MVNSVRAKMLVSCHVTKDFGGPTANKAVMLHCSYDPETPEDQRFCKATPSGTAELMIDNPEAIAFLKPGKTFYIDFTEVEPGK